MCGLRGWITLPGQSRLPLSRILSLMIVVFNCRHLLPLLLQEDAFIRLLEGKILFLSIDIFFESKPITVNYQVYHNPTVPLLYWINKMSR